MFAAGKIRNDVQTLVGTAARGAVHRAHRVDETGALLEHAVGQRSLRRDGGRCRGQQPALDVIRGQRGMRLQHQRDHTARDGRGLRGAGHGEHLLAK